LIGYEGFEIYREMGEGRSLAGVAEELERRHPDRRRVAVQTVRQWSSENRWRDRYWAWERWRDREKTKGEMVARRKLAKEVEERRLKQLARHEEESLGVARELKLKALKMLQWGLEDTVTTRVEVSEDGKVTHVHQTVMPAKWAMRDVPMFFKVGHDLEREVLGLSRSPAPGSGRSGEPAVSPDPDGLGDLERQTSAEVLQGAGRRLAAFEAEQRARRMRFPRRDVAPAGLGVVAAEVAAGVTAEAPAVTNGNGNGHSNGNGSNGHGNGNGHG
jgi:hypothetical protein